MKVYLQYVGRGSSLAGVPARHLSRDEAQAHGVDRLIKTGLYQLMVSSPKKPSPAPPKKSLLGGSENKQRS